MAVGRISGQLLTPTLERDGIDLTFTNNSNTLLHFDTANNRIGVKKTNPSYEFDIDGTVQSTTVRSGEAVIDDVTINDNIISTTVGNLEFTPATAFDRVIVNGDMEVTGAVTTATGSVILVQNTPPTGAVNGSIWMNSDNGRFYVYIVDVDSSQWIQPSIGVVGDFDVFANVQVGATVINAVGSDTVTFVAGENITISPNEINNEITITGIGVTQTAAIAYTIALG